MDWNNNAQVYEQIYAREGGVGTNSGYAVALSANGNRSRSGNPQQNTKGPFYRLDLSDTSDVKQVGITINGDVSDGRETARSIALKNNGNTLAIGDPKYDGANTPDNGHVRFLIFRPMAPSKHGIQEATTSKGRSLAISAAPH